MGRRSRVKREKRQEQAQEVFKGSGRRSEAGPKCAGRIAELEEELRCLADGDAVFCPTENCPEEIWQSHLEDILAFESVGSGTSLFEGLQKHGVSLPRPELLDEAQSFEKVTEVVNALGRLRVFLTGFEDRTAREVYSTLWNQTLWEGCYVEKRLPGAVTIIDISHKMSREELLHRLENVNKSSTVQ
jgi:hypothetical protein